MKDQTTFEKDAKAASSRSAETGVKTNSVVSNLKSAQRTIYEFLVGCTPFQADAVRVMVTFGYGAGEVSDINADDLLAVNRFLNFGMNKTNTKTADDVYMHRHKRMGVLLEALRPFLVDNASIRISMAAAMIASNPNAVRTAFSMLPDSSVPQTAH